MYFQRENYKLNKRMTEMLVCKTLRTPTAKKVVWEASRTAAFSLFRARTRRCLPLRFVGKQATEQVQWKGAFGFLVSAHSEKRFHAAFRLSSCLDLLRGGLHADLLVFCVLSCSFSVADLLVSKSRTCDPQRYMCGSNFASALSERTSLQNVTK